MAKNVPRPTRHGIPSHDTFNRLFARLKPEELQKCFISWMQAVHESTNHLVLGQIKVDEK
jgi:hypothetical protein